jgi:hypothetical protein
MDVLLQQLDISVYQLNSFVDCGKMESKKSLLWSKVLQSRFIESILIRLPLPAFYVRSDLTKVLHWHVIDGSQRIQSIHRFYKSDFKLQDLQILDFNGCSFTDLPKEYQTLFDYQTLLPFYCILPANPVVVDSIIQARVNNYYL